MDDLFLDSLKSASDLGEGEWPERAREMATPPAAERDHTNYRQMGTMYLTLSVLHTDLPTIRVRSYFRTLADVTL